MALSDFKVPTQTITAGGGQSFAVRGISADDLTFLLTRHPNELQTVIDQFMQMSNDKLSDDNAMSEFLLTFLPKIAMSFAPLVQSIIACASDDTGEAALAAAKRLPLSVQVDALVAIFNLSFEDPTGIKKLFAALNKPAPR